MKTKVKTKKKYFTLLEVIISLSLITIILTFLFGHFSKITKLEKNISTLKKEILTRNNTHIRLSNIFMQITPLDLEDFFYTTPGNDKSLNLHFSFDAGIDPDPYFSDIVDGKIYQKNKTLFLEILSKNKKFENSRKEILFEDIESYKIEFFSKKDLKLQDYKIKKITDEYYWYNFWPKDVHFLPEAIKLKIKFKNNKNVEFAFFLVSSFVKM